MYPFFFNMGYGKDPVYQRLRDFIYNSWLCYPCLLHPTEAEGSWMKNTNLECFLRFSLLIFGNSETMFELSIIFECPCTFLFTIFVPRTWAAEPEKQPYNWQHPEEIGMKFRDYWKKARSNTGWARSPAISGVRTPTSWVVSRVFTPVIHYIRSLRSAFFSWLVHPIYNWLKTAQDWASRFWCHSVPSTISCQPQLVITGFLVEPSTVGPKIQRPSAKWEDVVWPHLQLNPEFLLSTKRIPSRELTYHIPPWTRKLIDSKNIGHVWSFPGGYQKTEKIALQNSNVETLWRCFDIFGCGGLGLWPCG